MSAAHVRRGAAARAKAKKPSKVAVPKRLAKRLPHGLVRIWTLLVTAATTIVFFIRAYA